MCAPVRFIICPWVATVTQGSTGSLQGVSKVVSELPFRLRNSFSSVTSMVPEASESALNLHARRFSFSSSSYPGRFPWAPPVRYAV